MTDDSHPWETAVEVFHVILQRFQLAGSTGVFGSLAVSGHTATAEDPTADPQHWAKVVPAADGTETVAEWVSGKTYAKGDRVTKYGQVYESLMDANTLEPGVVGSDSAWSLVAA